jgi:hypothetical protein
MLGGGRDFRRAMREANGGIRPTYDVSLAARTQLARAAMVLGLLGIGASQVGPWAPDLRARAADRIDQLLPKRYAAVPTDAVRTEPAIPPVAGFDLNFAVDQNPERAWAAPWGAVPAAGQPCRRPGGTAALLITFRREAAVERVTIRAGLAGNNDQRALQFRPKLVDILFSDGTCSTVELGDGADAQKIEVKATALHARVTIVDVYRPSDQGDGLVSLSEVTFETRR